MSSWLASIDVSALATRAIAFLPDLLLAILILAGFWLAFRATRGSLRALLLRAGIHGTLVGMLVDNIYRFVMLVFAFVMAADQLGVNVGAALAGLGVAGIAVGFAAQDSLANTLAGFMIFWDKPFEVGHWVKVAGHTGQVREITMRSTRIRTRENTFVVIPNRIIIDQVLVNQTKEGELRVEVPLGIAYKESIPAARRVLLEALGRVAYARSDPAPEVVVTELGNSSVNLELRIWIDHPRDERQAFFEAIESAKLALDAAGIEIPFPHLQLFLDEIRPPVWEGFARHRRGA